MTPRLGRWRGLPKSSRPALDAQERLLAWASTPSGAVVATNLGLWLPGRAARLGWHEIHKVSWAPPRLTIIAAVRVDTAPEYAVMADLAPETITLDHPGELPHTVRQRVTRSVAYTQHQPVPGGGGVRVVARRVPGVDGLSWHVRFEDGASHTDERAAAIAAGLIAAVGAGSS